MQPTLWSVLQVGRPRGVTVFLIFSWSRCLPCPSHIQSSALQATVAPFQLAGEGVPAFPFPQRAAGPHSQLWGGAPRGPGLVHLVQMMLLSNGFQETETPLTSQSPAIGRQPSGHPNGRWTGRETKGNPADNWDWREGELDPA